MREDKNAEGEKLIKMGSDKLTDKSNTSLLKIDDLNISTREKDLLHALFKKYEQVYNKEVNINSQEIREEMVNSGFNIETYNYEKDTNFITLSFFLEKYIQHLNTKLKSESGILSFLGGSLEDEPTEEITKKITEEWNVSHKIYDSISEIIDSKISYGFSLRLKLIHKKIVYNTIPKALKDGTLKNPFLGVVFTFIDKYNYKIDLAFFEKNYVPNTNYSELNNTLGSTIKQLWNLKEEEEMVFSNITLNHSKRYGYSLRYVPYNTGNAIFVLSPVRKINAFSFINTFESIKDKRKKQKEKFTQNKKLEKKTYGAKIPINITISPDNKLELSLSSKKFSIDEEKCKEEKPSVLSTLRKESANIDASNLKIIDQLLSLKRDKSNVSLVCRIVEGMSPVKLIRNKQNLHLITFKIQDLSNKMRDGIIVNIWGDQSLTQFDPLVNFNKGDYYWLSGFTFKFNAENTSAPYLNNSSEKSQWFKLEAKEIEEVFKIYSPV